MYPLVKHESKSLFLLHNIILCLKMVILGSAAISQGVKKKKEENKEEDLKHYSAQDPRAGCTIVPLKASDRSQR